MTTPTLMVQGCTSNAGKSVLVAGLCRFFYRQGYRVAPFKPQNMALNSAVTVDGGEIGRSQAVQAQACNVPPHTDMNPILLKPNSDQGAQVIIHGHIQGNQNAREYHAFKQHAMSYALESYERLAADYELIIIEGAGSPAEINLRANDIANMGFAIKVNCPVILVADIDRGGVFAHLTGTIACLEPDEQALVKGFVINRFRGDPTLLDAGIYWLTEKTGIPTLGVLPFLHGLHIEAEDAVDKCSSVGAGSSEKLRVVVPRIPRISNHTDLDVLRLNPDLEVSFIEAGEEKPACDLVALPGSKNTINDLEWLKKNAWPNYLTRHLRYGGKLIGVCGGYQMIGRKIHDPDGVEGPARSVDALGLMNFETTLAPKKHLTNVSGKLFGSDASVVGYEIHMGETCGDDLSRPAVELDDGRHDGAVSADGQIICSYLHGLFDHPEACQALLQWAGLDTPDTFDYAALKEREINRVADMLEKEMDIEKLISNLGLRHPADRPTSQAG